MKMFLTLKKNKLKLVSLLIFIILALFAFSKIPNIKIVSGRSMYPTLSPGTLVKVVPLDPSNSQDISQLEIFIYDEPSNDHPKSLIKRVVGIPGDVLEYKNNKLYVNNLEYSLPIAVRQDMLLTVPPDSFYMLGDNTEESIDSRASGFIPRSNLKYKVIKKVF